MSSVVVLGGSIAGLTSALLLSRAGHQVTVLERDADPLPSHWSTAARWPRASVPQTHHAHSFSGRVRRFLALRLPDLLEDLETNGSETYHQGEWLPATAVGADQVDPRRLADLASLGCRRTTFEWVLRRRVAAQPGLALHTGVTVTGLRWQPGKAGQPPRANGVLTRERGEIRADIVIDATGRRSRLVHWAREAGVVIPEQSEDCEIVAHTRFFRILDPSAMPRMPRGNVTTVVLDGCGAYAFLADNSTVAVVLARHPYDAGLARMRDPGTFEAMASLVPAVAPWVDPLLSAPISGVAVMAGLRNSMRHFLDSGRPRLMGVYPVGDAFCVTDPAYGRGVALASAQVEMVVDAINATPDPSVEQAERVYRSLTTFSAPWLRDCVRHDRARTAGWRAAIGLPPSQLPLLDTAVPFGTAAAAAAVDAQIWVDLARVMNVVQHPGTVFDNPALAERIAGLDLPALPAQPRRADLLRVVQRQPSSTRVA
jgi:2-polyprenyl-6-methoxyphenol hydroxylase-like FAD-dependent oxidoreductase